MKMRRRILAFFLAVVLNVTAQVFPTQAVDADEYRMNNQNVLKSLKGFKATDELPLIKTTLGEYYTYTNDGGKTEWNRVDYTHGNASRLITANLTRGWNKGLSGLMVDYGEYINADWFFCKWNDRKRNAQSSDILL